MPKKETIFNISQILEELKDSNGLPDNLSTEAQLWDEILKKETFLFPEQLFPLIHEIYGKSYPKDTSITPLGTEYSVERSDTKEITSIRADITVLINQKDIYLFLSHFYRFASENVCTSKRRIPNLRKKN